MKQPTKTSNVAASTAVIPISEIPPFVTPAELNVVDQLSDGLRVLTAQLSRLCVPHHENNPTDARNFQALLCAHTDSVILGKHLVFSPMLNIVEGAMARHRKRIIEFAIPLLERALKDAEARCNKIIAAERQHHFEMTGTELPPDPPPPAATSNVGISASSQAWHDSNRIVQTARVPVAKLERLIVNKEAEKMLAFLSAHASATA
jgi:hypothetical protein